MSDKKERKAWDRFAAAALQGLMARPEAVMSADEAAAAAAAAADSLLRVRAMRWRGGAPPSTPHEVD